MQERLFIVFILSFLSLAGIANADPLPIEVTTFFNPYMLSMAFIIGISGVFALWVGGKYSWIVFLIIASTLTLFLSIIGFYPKWILILSLLVVAGIVMKLVLSGFK